MKCYSYNGTSLSVVYECICICPRFRRLIGFWLANQLTQRPLHEYATPSLSEVPPLGRKTQTNGLAQRNFHQAISPLVIK